MPTTGSTTPDSDRLAAFVAGLPKAELHVHQVGSAGPELVSQLAQRHPGVVPQDPAELREYFRFRDFAHFVDVYLSVVDLIRDGDDVRLLTWEVAKGLAAQNVRYAELTVTPYTSMLRGIAVEAFVDAIEDARVAAERDLGLVLRWITDIPGESGIPAAEATCEVALTAFPSTLVGFGLGGPEIGVPRPQFKPYFDRARAAGLRSVPHAGETTGPETVWDALRELGAERIGHGTSSAQDPALLEHLAEHRIPLEVSVTSNLATRAVERLEEHPLPRFVAAGVPVSINTDDPPMFNTDLQREYLLAARLLGLDHRGLADLACAAVHASFLDEAGKRRLVGEIRSYADAYRPTA